jgi:uncharacterized membrane protein YoaK (UPF0700 family)
MDFLRRTLRPGQTHEVVHQPLQEHSLFDFLADRPSESELHLYGPVSGLRPQRRRIARDKFGIALSSIAGFVDAAGFMALFGLFPAHVTGELVSVLSGLAPGHRVHILERVGLILVFLSAVVVATLVARSARRWSHMGRPQLAPLFTLLTLSLLMFCAFGSAFEWVGRSPHSALSFLAPASAVASMGVQNALMRLGLNTCLPTTVMTGNLTQATVELVELLAARMAPSEEERARGAHQNKTRLIRVLLSVAGFTLGASLAIVLTAAVGLLSVLLPTVLAAGLSVAAWREFRQR